MRLASLAILCIALTACGGGGGGGSSSTTPPPPSNGTGSPPGQAVPVTVASGQTVGGIDVTVPAPNPSPGPNAELLGVSPQLSGASAFSTGDTITRGSTQVVLLFGPGLSGGMTVSISGPGDIAISNQRSIQSTDNTPGIAFTATVAPNAAPGLRTVNLVSGDNMTTFTGGLEVLP